MIFKDLKSLKKYISNEVKSKGPKLDLTYIDVSGITDLSYLFTGDLADFNGDISNWNVSKVQNMNSTFKDSKFNGDISNWNVSKVKDMSIIFGNSLFDGNISKWKIPKIRSINFPFKNSKVDIYHFLKNNEDSLDKLNDYVIEYSPLDEFLYKTLKHKNYLDKPYAISNTLSIYDKILDISIFKTFITY